jgi:pimeloyl-ACP methyl ester carboxylesterase
VRHGGEGTPVVLLHGHPRTHTTWYQVAPLLAEDHFVVCRRDAAFAQSWWHWFFFGQLAKPAERVICADPETWYNVWTVNSPDRLGPENHADFLAAIRDPRLCTGCWRTTARDWYRPGP